MKKKILIAVIITVAFIPILFGLYFTYIHTSVSNISSIDNSFNISIPKTVTYKLRNASDSDYKLDFYSVKDEMFFYSNSIEKNINTNIFNAITAEKDSLIANIASANSISEISKISINNYECYKYNYIYHDDSYGKDMYAEVVWICADKNVYILDLEVVAKNIEKYIPIFEKIENSFVEN